MTSRGRILLCLALAAVMPAADATASPGGIGEIYETWRDHVVAITYTLRPLEKPTGGEGRKVENAVCGVLVDAAGLIVTTADPFPDPGGDPRATLYPVEFKVHLRGGRPLDAEAVGMDRDLNLAYLRLKNPPPGLRALRFSERARPGVGDEVIVIGLMSREYDYEPAVYKGLVNAVVEKPRRMYSLDVYLQDLSIGGLVVTRGGEPIGIIGVDVLEESRTQDRTPSNLLSIFGSLTPGRRPGYSMVYPYSVFAGQLASPPPIAQQEKRSWLGIVMQPLNEDLIEYWKLDASGGIIISSVVEGSPAEKAGLRQGDILVELQGEPLRVTKDDQLADFRRRIERMGMSRPVELALLRRGERERLSLMLSEAPKTAWTAEEFKDDDLGMTTREITIDDLQGQNLDPTTRGVVVDEMEQAGWAQIAGLQAGDIIQSVDAQATLDLASFRALIDRLREQRPPEILFFVQRQSETLFVLLKASWPKAR